MSFLEANLGVLRERDPEGTGNLLGPVSPGDTLELLPAASGELTARFRDAYLHSPRDPRREAERFIRSEEKADRAVLIMEGFALGYHAEAFASLHPDSILWIVEPDLPQFLQVLAARDLRKLLANPRVLLFLNPHPEDLARTAARGNSGEFGIIKLRSVYEKDREYYEAVDRALQAVLVRRKVNKNTLRKFGRLWVRNLFQNLPLLPAARGIGLLDHCLEGLPALLLAAGPSLDDILPLLPELRRKMVLIAVDTSCRAVLETGTLPDFLVVVDPQYWNTRHLDGTDLSGMILISDSSTHPRIFRRVPEGLYLCESHFPLGRFLEESTGVRGRISAGGSVATFAWETARITGTGPVYCAGLDLAYPEGMTHKKESFFEKQALFRSGRLRTLESLSAGALYDQEPRPVPNNRGGFTLSDSRMAVYIRWFESRIAGTPGPETFTLSPLGAAIPGISPASPETLLELPDRREEIDRRLEPFRKPGEAPPPEREFLERLKSLRGELEALIALSRRGLELTDRLEVRLSRKENPEGEIGLLNEVDRRILGSAAGNIAGFLFQDLIDQLEAPTREGEDPLENSRKLYRELAASGEFHLGILERSLERLAPVNFSPRRGE